MLDQTNANIERHIKTHSVRSDDDRAAVSGLETFLRSNGRINTSFASNDVCLRSSHFLGQLFLS